MPAGVDVFVPEGFAGELPAALVVLPPFAEVVGDEFAAAGLEGEAVLLAEGEVLSVWLLPALAVPAEFGADELAFVVAGPCVTACAEVFEADALPALGPARLVAFEPDGLLALAVEFGEPEILDAPSGADCELVFAGFELAVCAPVPADVEGDVALAGVVVPCVAFVELLAGVVDEDVVVVVPDGATLV